MTAAASGALERLWFPVVPAARLGVLRILIGLFALYEAATHYDQWIDIGETKASLFAPVGVVSVLHQPLPPHVFEGLVVACIAANVAFVLGWRHRFTGPVFAALLLGVMSYRNSWSMIYHSSNLMVLHVLILGMTPCADALSLDAWRHRRTGGRAVDDSWLYGWPIQLVCAVTTATYLLAAVAKIAGPLGWEWATADALRGQIAANALRKEVLGDSSPSLFYAIYDQTWLFGGLAALSLGLELGAPLALLDRRLGRLWSAATLCMHWGIYAIMGITFRYPLSGLAFASFFPLERLVPRVGWVASLWKTPARLASLDESVPMNPR